MKPKLIEFQKLFAITKETWRKRERQLSLTIQLEPSGGIEPGPLAVAQPVSTIRVSASYRPIVFNNGTNQRSEYLQICRYAH